MLTSLCMFGALALIFIHPIAGSLCTLLATVGMLFGKSLVQTFKSRPRFSRAQGASSGVESYFIGLIVLYLPLYTMYGFSGFLLGLALSFLTQVVIMSGIDRKIMFYAAFSQKLGPSVMRNGSIGFAECVRPDGKPTADHSLILYSFSPPVTSLIFGSALILILAVNPVVAFIRLFYQEHIEGVNSGRWTDLYLLFLRHPLAVQATNGEGPSNGDGLASMCASESLVYPITPKRLLQGPAEGAYWKVEGRPRLRDMFHDKVFCHRFFEEHNVAHPVLVAQVVDHKTTKIHMKREDAPTKLIWKPRYSTMSLGVEHFTGWEKMGNGKDWAPSADPYVIEEFLVSTEFPEAAEWYRMPTIWAYDEDAPKLSYIWRTRNELEDKRVQTDIIGGAYCIPDGCTTFVGPNTQGKVVDPRTGDVSLINSKVERACKTAIEQATRMHKSLGKELFSIGWDFIIVDDKPVFIEFNINNGFYVADHSIEEVLQMINFYGEQFNARLGPQLLDFDPHAADAAATYLE